MPSEAIDGRKERPAFGCHVLIGRATTGDNDSSFVGFTQPPFNKLTSNGSRSSSSQRMGVQVIKDQHVVTANVLQGSISGCPGSRRQIDQCKGRNLLWTAVFEHSKVVSHQIRNELT